jgi:hypothetical protein
MRIGDGANRKAALTLQKVQWHPHKIKLQVKIMTISSDEYDDAVETLADFRASVSGVLLTLPRSINGNQLTSKLSEDLAALVKESLEDVFYDILSQARQVRDEYELHDRNAMVRELSTVGR